MQTIPQYDKRKTYHTLYCCYTTSELMDKCQGTGISLTNDITIKQFMLYGAYGPGLPCVLMCVSGAVQVGVVQSKSPEGCGHEPQWGELLWWRWWWWSVGASISGEERIVAHSTTHRLVCFTGASGDSILGLYEQVFNFNPCCKSGGQTCDSWVCKMVYWFFFATGDFLFFSCECQLIGRYKLKMKWNKLLLAQPPESTEVSWSALHRDVGSRRCCH